MTVNTLPELQAAMRDSIEHGEPITEVTAYENHYDGRTVYGITFQGRENRHITSPACKNARVIWRADE